MDANGNQTTRTINGVTVTLAYDAEGHLVSVTGQGINAAFTYDGGGKLLLYRPTAPTV